MSSNIRRILTIDDNDAIHNDFKKILVGTAAPSKLSAKKSLLFGDAAPAESKSAQKFEFEVDSALQGEEGFARLKQATKDGRPYSVAFVDMRMPPGWDGLQTIQAMWEVDPELQVVICTAYSDYSWEEITNKLGLTDRLLILKKPFDPAEVTQLATALSEKRSLRESSKLKFDELEKMVAHRTQELTKLAMFDKLTGLANRILFNQRLESAIAKQLADKSASFSVMFLDFDRFKVINDSLGHETGDRVLKGIADRLSAAMALLTKDSGEALAARLGGDEFTILLEKFDGSFDPTHFATQLLKLLAAPYQIDSREMHCTASIGITTSEIGYTHPEAVLRDADSAMYHAKAAGKARYVMFDQRMHADATARLEMENALRLAWERGEIFLHYQPMVCLASGQLRGFEALARWNHPELGLISPLTFIKCAEEIGLIETLGLRLLEQGCQQLRQWEIAYPHQPLTLSVNISPRQFRAELVGHVADILRRTGIRPQSLSLEITESAMMHNMEEAVAILKQLRELGVELHLDDFGTGYSSLSSLHQFPLTGLKIDRSFIKNVSEQRSYLAVVNAIISLARQLGMKLIAEGIETPEQVSMLQALDCDLAQGFYFGKPLSTAAAEEMVRTGREFKKLAA